MTAKATPREVGSNDGLGVMHPKHAGTWYGWNLRSWVTRHMAARVRKWFYSKSSRARPKKLRHPRIKLAWGGLWKPLRVGPPYAFRWKKDRRKWL